MGAVPLLLIRIKIRSHPDTSRYSVLCYGLALSLN